MEIETGTQIRPLVDPEAVKGARLIYPKISSVLLVIPRGRKERGDHLEGLFSRCYLAGLKISLGVQDDLGEHELVVQGHLKIGKI